MVVHSPYMVHASTMNVDPARRIRLSTDIRYQRVRDEGIIVSRLDDLSGLLERGVRIAVLAQRARRRLLGELFSATRDPGVGTAIKSCGDYIEALSTEAKPFPSECANPVV